MTILRVLLLAVVILYSATVAMSAVLGGNKGDHMVGNPREAKIDDNTLELLKFAIEENNKVGNLQLQFKSNVVDISAIVSYTRQVVAGVNHGIVADVEDSKGASHRFKFIIYERAWLNERKLSTVSEIFSQ